MHRIRISQLVFLWAAVIVGLTAAGALHASKPGAAAEAPGAWPSGTSLFLVSDRPSVLLFVHPQCPCTRATLVNLAELLPQLSRPVSVQVVAFQPGSADAAWRDTTALRLAEDTFRTPVVYDEGAAEIKRFGAKTSGEIFAYAPDGRLLFHGGITPSRGHEGPSPGGTLLRERLEDPSLPAAVFKTFGCAL